MARYPVLLVPALVVALSGCSTDDLRRVGYHALLDRQCMVETGRPNCDPDRMSYDTYQQERAQLLNPAATR